MQAKLALDLILIENLVQVLAHSLMKDNVSEPGRALVVTRELLRGICLNCKQENPGNREAYVCFETLEEGKLRIRIHELGPLAGTADLNSSFRGTSEYGLIQKLSESVRFEGDSIEATVAFCPI